MQDLRRNPRGDRWRAVLLVPALLLALAFLLAMIPALASAHAQTATASAPAAAAPLPSLTPAEAQRALDVLLDDARRAETIRLLRALADAPAAAAATPSSAVAPAPEPAPAAASETIERDGLLSQVLQGIGTGTDSLIDRIVALIVPLAGLPAAWEWLVDTLADPHTHSLLLDAAWKVAIALGLAALAEWGTHRALVRPRRALVAAATPPAATAAVDPQARLGLGRRCLLACAGFGLDMLPLLAFALVGITVAAVGTLVVALAFEQRPTSRLIVMILINAHIAWGVLTALAYRLTSPDIFRLRTLPLDDGDADYAYRTARRIVSLVVCVMAGLEIARILGISTYAYGALLKLMLLLVHGILIVAVLHCRRGVAGKIRGTSPKTGILGMMRGWAAAVWHLAAIFFLLAMWLVWAADVRDGYVLILRFFFSTVAVLVAAQLLAMTVLRGLDRLFTLEARDLGRFSMVQERASHYYPLVRRLILTAGVILTLLLLLQVWGFGVVDWFEDDSGIASRLLSAATIVAIAGILALAVWEGVNAAVERHLNALGQRGDRARAARLRTLLPLLRSSLLIFVIGIVGLTALSEIGVNIAPLLAGAGIVGVAIGFGSQKLVQDVITGVFLLLENVMHVGDNVTVAGLSGTVENLSIRTIRLRAGDGSVHVIPFSSVGTVTNANRGIGNAAVSVSIDYAEDTDRVGEVLKDIAAEIRKDPAYSSMILDDLALWGVDAVNGGSVTIVGQIRCLDSGRWGVQREFNRRLKKRFQELGIKLADPAKSVLVPAGEDDSQPVLPLASEPGPTSATQTRSPPPSALGNTA